MSWLGIGSGGLGGGNLRGLRFAQDAVESAIRPRSRPARQRDKARFGAELLTAIHCDGESRREESTMKLDSWTYCRVCGFKMLTWCLNCAADRRIR